MLASAQVQAEVLTESPNASDPFDSMTMMIDPESKRLNRLQAESE